MTIKWALGGEEAWARVREQYKQRECVYEGRAWVSVRGLVRWSEHVLCFIWEDEATGPGKLCSSTIPRESHHSSIQEDGERGMRKHGGGGGKKRKVMIGVKERCLSLGCVDERFLLHLWVITDNWPCRFPETNSPCCSHLLQFPTRYRNTSTHREITHP